jgi:hypothetical protein
LVRSHEDDEELELPADWVIVSNNPATLQNSSLRVHAIPFKGPKGLRAWTDDYNNLVEILKRPEIK